MQCALQCATVCCSACCRVQQCVLRISSFNPLKLKCGPTTYLRCAGHGPPLCVTCLTHFREIRCALQCVAVCCSVLQCVAVCCSVLQCAAVCSAHFNIVRSASGVGVCCSVRCSALQCYTVRVAGCCSVFCVSQASKPSNQSAGQLRT